jgi:hypothetical protein
MILFFTYVFIDPLNLDRLDKLWGLDYNRQNTLPLWKQSRKIFPSVLKKTDIKNINRLIGKETSIFAVNLG